MSAILTVAGRCLPDVAMPVFDHKRQVKMYPQWADVSFGRVATHMQALASANTISNQYIIPEHTPISDQGRAGTCVANTVADLLEVLIGLVHPNNVPQLSRRFGYWISRYLTGDTDKDEGTYLRAMLMQLSAIGIVEEKYFPYSDQEVDLISSEQSTKAEPELDLYTMASNNRINALYRIDSMDDQRVREVELAIRANHPVPFGTRVGKSFMAYNGDGTVFGPPSDEDFAGLHAMFHVGVRINNGKREFLTRNSWSRFWGQNGHVWLNEEYVMQHTDVWVGTQLSGLV